MCKTTKGKAIKNPRSEEYIRKMQNTSKPGYLKKQLFYENIYVVDENIFWIGMKNLSIEIMTLQRLYSL